MKTKFSINNAAFLVMFAAWAFKVRSISELFIAFATFTTLDILGYMFELSRKPNDKPNPS